MLYADFDERSKTGTKAKAAITHVSIGIVIVQLIGIIIYPRFKKHILERCIIDPDPPEIMPELEDDPRRHVSQSSIEGTPLINDQDANKPGYEATNNDAANI